MKLYYNFAFILLFMMGCVSLNNLDTYNKKIAAFEIGYSETLKTAKLWLTDPKVEQGIKDNIKSAIKDAETARFAMRIAEVEGDLREATTQLKLAQNALNILREIVRNE